MNETTARRKFGKLRGLLKEKEGFKEVYEQIDQLTMELVAAGLTEHTFRSGDSITVIDNFRGKNVAFRPAKFTRFEAKLDTAD